MIGQYFDNNGDTRDRRGHRTDMDQLTWSWTNNINKYIDNIYENMKQPFWGYNSSTQTVEENIFKQ